MIKTKLREEIENELEALGKEELGSDKYNKTVIGIANLIDKLNDIESREVEAEFKQNDRFIDYELKTTQMKHETRDRLWKNSIAIGGIIIPAGISIWGAFKTWEFEENGTITSLMGRLFTNIFGPKRLN